MMRSTGIKDPELFSYSGSVSSSSRKFERDMSDPADGKLGGSSLSTDERILAIISTICVPFKLFFCLPGIRTQYARIPDTASLRQSFFSACPVSRTVFCMPDSRHCEPAKKCSRFRKFRSRSRDFSLHQCFGEV